jgi:hypothetical protein
MHPSPDHMQFALMALSAIYVAERLWLLVAKIIAFFDKRAAANKKIQVAGREGAESKHKTRGKLPIAAGGPLPKPQTPLCHRASAQTEAEPAEGMENVSAKRAA